MNNMIKQQTNISKEELGFELTYVPEFERTVGFFSVLMLKSTKHYLVNYLNELIHGLLTAMREYTFHHMVKIIRKPEITIEEYVRKCEQMCKGKKMASFDEKHIPELITFKIGDLLRCKCTSK